MKMMLVSSLQLMDFKPIQGERLERGLGDCHHTRIVVVITRFSKETVSRREMYILIQILYGTFP